LTSANRSLHGAALALVAAALVLAWQWATVAANYGGNWTALFCTGGLLPQPPLAAAEHVYVFAGSSGYDGQAYHYIAHDPFMRSGLKAYVDAPRLRYRRILVPLLAYALAAGRSEWIDPAIEIVFLLAVVLGVYWSCRFARETGLAAAWGLLFLAMPAIPISMDRLVTDAGLAALTAAFLCYSRTPSWKLFLVLACAALTRETGFLLILAYWAYLLWRSEFRHFAVFLLTAVPAAAWYLYVQARTAPQPFSISLIPLSSILEVLLHPWKYPPRIPFAGAVLAADYVALAGVLLAVVLAAVFFLRRPSDPVRIAAVLFALLVLALQRVDVWLNAYSYGRICTPLFLCLAAIGAQSRKPWLLAPTAMLLPRLAIQLTPQFLGVLRWLA
jgi:hypothetical protein